MAKNQLNLWYVNIKMKGNLLNKVSANILTLSLAKFKLLLTFFQHLNSTCLRNVYPRKPMTITKYELQDRLEASIYPQELSNHTIILFCNISERFNYFSPRILQHWLPSVNNASRYTDGSFLYKYWLFIKLQKMEGAVFIALGTSHGDFEPPRASISPQSPPSLKPAL